MDQPTPPDSSSRTNASPGFFSRLIRSCYDRNLYRHAVDETGGRAVWYVFRMLILAGILLGSGLGLQAWTIADDITAALEHDLPTVEFDNGDLTIDAETPARYSLGEHGQLVIDPHGEETRAALPPEVRIVFVNGRMFVRGPEHEFTGYSTRLFQPGEASDPEDPSGQFSFNGQQLRDWLPVIKGILLGVGIVLGLVYAVLFNLFRILLFSLGGFLALMELTTRLSTGDVLKVSCYAVTPVALVSAALVLLSVSLPWGELIYLTAGTLWVYLITKHLGQHPDYHERNRESPSS